MLSLMSLDSVRNSKVVSIVGYGVVGRATHLIMDQNQQVLIHDPQLGYTVPINDLLDSDYIFLCLPTPSDAEGYCDTTLLSDYLEELSVNWKQGPLVVVRSTCTPDFLEAWSEQVDLVFFPEFLTERNWREDALNPRCVILGGDRRNTQSVKSLLESGTVYADKEITTTDLSTASLMKYATNCFYATKVTYMNLLHDVAEKMEVDWSEFMRVLQKDHRMGPEHLDVPGPDGKKGFGGKCFPKDLRAFINYSNELSVESSLLKTVLYENKKYRND